MKRADWTRAAKASADPARAEHHFRLLTASVGDDSLAGVNGEHLRILAAVLAGSQALANLLVANPGWVESLKPDRLGHARSRSGLLTEWKTISIAALAQRDYAGALTELRRFKQRETLRIAARDLARLSNAVEITREISDLADVCLSAVWEICRQQFAARFGAPFHQDVRERWQATEVCVLGMGKLGGQELNYSSDVDVLFVYADEGSVFKEPPGKTRATRAVMSSHQFFNRLAEAFIAEVSRMTSDGMLYRIDLRLRPEGDTGPLTRALESYENYYAQWGQTWERMMLIKARCVAGSESLGHEFLEMVQPFRHPRQVNERVLREVAAMKDRIENEVVKSDELERNVKLGRGGIREIEFIAQSQQLLHAGRQPFLQGAQTLPTLEKLAQYNLLGAHEVRELRDAYCFLRDVEHRLQMEDNQQTHTIPTAHAARERLARIMGFASSEEFDAARAMHTTNVRRVYDRLLRGRPKPGESEFPEHFDGCENEWRGILQRHRFRDPDAALRVLREFVEGPGYVHVSPRTSELARELLPKIFALCRWPECGKEKVVREVRVLSDPDRVLTRLDSFISAYGTRAALFELWASHPPLLELLLLLFDRSEFLAERAIRVPDLVDELVMAGRLRQQKSAEEILADLRHGAGDADQFVWLRKYHEAELMRLGLRDILGLVSIERNFTELSALADACLQYALEAVMRQNKLKSPPFAVVGLGKLGGGEINYGSDLDVVFVTEAPARELPRLQKLAAQFMDLVSRRTEQGTVFQLDARLRPDGEKGLLVNTLVSYEEYYRTRAQLWEIQSLTRARAVAGNSAVGKNFSTLAKELTDFRLSARRKLEPSHVSCYSADWKRKVHEMRERIEKERTPRGRDELAIKTGQGGLMDAEFIAQALCLEHGWQEPHALRALERARDERVLRCAEQLIENYRQLRLVEGILRRWSYEGETVLPVEPEPYYRVSVRCGFQTPEDFRAALAGWRRAVREVFIEYFA